MADTSNMNAVCAQLLTPDDLNISVELYEKVKKESIVTNILVNKSSVSIKIYSTQKLHLSTVLPILDDFGFDIIDEVTFDVVKNKDTIFTSRFNLNLENNEDILKAKDNIETVITSTLKYENIKRCKLYSLVYKENFNLRNIFLLRAYIEYIDQAEISLSSDTILNTIRNHPKLSTLFVEYFDTKFNPKIEKREESLKKLEITIEDEIKKVPSIMDDKILKLTNECLKSTLRTNFYLNKETISLKIDAKEYGKNLKGLQPNIEAFVYNSQFYGVHLRMSKISRGGLRWSERHEDYRQEIKSLMITQEGKNSIIIPDGAKGGFVINKDKTAISKEYFEEMYSAFISNLLDLVDNVKDDEVIRDENIIAYDGDDTYFVVAADKGTASMSDVANQIAIDRGYWLGDAFASGGSNGYGHKKLGITARGSIMSTKRFFIEEGIDIYKDSISVVGLGSMNGDVFGNGMLDSKEFKLLAAIGHKEIFIDPDPIPLTSFEERQRLFLSKNGSWAQYSKALISKGGGIFSRSEKNIELSPEIKKMINTTKKTMSGEELCKKLLTMKVDLLFNGGVGTYVKASDENNLDIGDKQNEAVRVDAKDLNARIVCEGGNLGFTQKARIEYALNGGKINLDGIDNAAGVDTSDHEVNLKILLNTIEAKGILCTEENKSTLHSLTDQVVNLVLWSNYQQALAISTDETLSKKYLEDFTNVIEVLENNIEAFNRTAFYIPKNENISEIITKEGSIVRPILASLLSYSKILMKKVLLESKLIDEPFAISYLYKYFPKSFVGAYEHEILSHPLKREIIATKIADFILNSQGVTFVSNFEKIGKEKFLQKIKAYLVMSQLFSAKNIRFEIYRSDFKLPISKQYDLIDKLEHTLNFSTKWMVKYLDYNQVDSTHILDHKDDLFKILEEMNNKTIPEIIEGNDEFNRFYGVIDYLRFAIIAITLKEKSQHKFEDLMIVFYSVIHEFKILELIASLNEIKLSSRSDQTQKTQVLQFIEYIIEHYTEKILAFKRLNETPDEAFKNYLENEKDSYEIIREKIDNFMGKESKDLQDISITVNQLMVSAI